MGGVVLLWGRLGGSSLVWGGGGGGGELGLIPDRSMGVQSTGKEVAGIPNETGGDVATTIPKLNSQSMVAPLPACSSSSDFCLQH